MARLQPLPKKQSSQASHADAPTIGSGGVVGKALIQPRRMALKYETSTLVIEYKENSSGKLRHRTIHIDTERFGSVENCVARLSSKLSRVVVAGSIPTEQVHRLVSQLFLNKKDGSLGSEDLDADTDAFLNRHPTELQSSLTAVQALESITSSNAIDPSPSPATQQDTIKPERKTLIALPRKSPPPEEKIAPSASAVAAAEKEEEQNEKDGMEVRTPAASAGVADADEAFDVPDSPVVCSSSSTTLSSTKPSLEPLPKIGSTIASLSVDATSPVKAHTDSPGSAARKPESPSPVSPTPDSIVSEVLDYDDDFEDDDSPHKSVSSPSKQQHLAGREAKNGDGDGDEADNQEEGEGLEGHKDDGNAVGGAVNKGKDAAERKLRGDDVNLNHLDKDELDEYKRLMEIEFEKNAIKPDDPRYKHDVQVDFDEPEEDAGWDEEDDYVPSDEDDNDVELFLP